ncbi:hypothetical protein FIBSPDRAFT_875270 [Athelia psychrophila]|uniref:Nucleoporin POM152 first Ig-like domain-containing protein n=1 Tax=Athelia psychrophila TaxID=1759441 RepID=A0A165WJH6_9AGAM|nr:hypothetical protein FIBSPDRAFT_875270 [Fibularhizoctonia sp. CBS 109695]
MSPISTTRLNPNAHTFYLSPHASYTVLIPVLHNNTDIANLRYIITPFAILRAGLGRERYYVELSAKDLNAIEVGQLTNCPPFDWCERSIASTTNTTTTTNPRTSHTPCSLPAEDAVARTHLSEAKPCTTLGAWDDHLEPPLAPHQPAGAHRRAPARRRSSRQSI